MVEGGFQFTGVAIAVGKGRAQALADVTAFLERAKQSGTVKDAFARAGLSHLDVRRNAASSSRAHAHVSEALQTRDPALLYREASWIPDHRSRVALARPG